MSTPQPDDYDFSEELRGKEEPAGVMNEKHSSLGPAIIAAIIVAGCDVGVKFAWERATDTTTAAALAELRTNVANLSTQLSEFTKQPYIRRDEFESRLTGFDQRISYIEREEQLRSKR